MPEQEPTTQAMKISDLNDQLSDLVNAVCRNETRVLLMDAGIPVAALVSAADLMRLRQLDPAWAEGTRALERFSEAFADVPTAELEAKIDQIIADLRRHDAKEPERQPA